MSLWDVVGVCKKQGRETGRGFVNSEDGCVTGSVLMPPNQRWTLFSLELLRILKERVGRHILKQTALTIGPIIDTRREWEMTEGGWFRSHSISQILSLSC